MSTIKRLFALTQNRCAFPSCSVVAYDPGADEVLVEICHIEGARPGSPRYRDDQTDHERHGFDNLLLMCGHHHNLIDGDETTFTVTRLREIKATHEAHAVRPEALDDELVDSATTRLLVNYTAITISADTVVWSQNQIGGQIAKTIINEMPPPWGLTPAACAKLTHALGQMPPVVCELKHVQGDPDSARLATQLRSSLEAAGWEVKGYAMLGPSQPAGLRVGLARPGDGQLPPQASTLVAFLWRAKLLATPTVIPDPGCKNLTLVVGHRPDDAS